MKGDSTAVRAIPVLAGAAPMLVVLLAYGISIHYGTVPQCLVFWDGCVSISAAGRYPPAVFLFKGGLLPAATIIALYWWLVGSWLFSLGETRPAGNLVRVIGIIGAIFLMLYITYLGSDGDVYRLLRRYGVTVYFAFTALAQILVAASMLRRRTRSLVRLARAKLTLCGGLLLLGLAVAFMKPFLAEPDRLENAVEWIFATLMQTNFLLTYLAWRATGVSTRLFARPDGQGD